MISFKKLTLLLLSCFLFSACNSWYEIPEVVYVIEKGAHKSNVAGTLPGNGIRALKSETFRIKARFDASAIYHLNGNDQADINKLFGFSDCNSNHQENSARFGWNYSPEDAKVNIYAYLYTNGKRVIKLLGQVAIHEEMQYELKTTDTHFIFNFNGLESSFERGSNCSQGLYYMLYPYFGGNTPAPHEIRIYIQEEH